MNDDRTNTVDISGMLTNSPVIVNQNQDGMQSIADTHIEYAIDESTVRVFPQKPAEKMNGIFVVTVVIASLSVFADMLGVLSYIGIQKGMAILLLGPICLLMALITKKDRWLVSLQADGSAQFSDGLWYEKLPDGNFMSYVKRAKCVYPKCNGLVRIVPAPPRERYNHSLVGKCSVGGIRHTYTVDYNGIGYPREFDWRPLEQEKKA
ncbi:MAG: hypothetical protein LBV29_01655 [Azoarcus sp.]|nr:hypothetical protein [Azoarcus sp.]